MFIAAFVLSRMNFLGSGQNIQLIVAFSHRVVLSERKFLLERLRFVF